MKIDELRIGNYVYWDSGATSPDILTQIGFDEMEILASSQNENLIKPVPLTSDWLAKIEHLGPTNHEGVPSYFNGDNILIRVQDMSFFMHSELDGSVHWVRYLRYVHELQNLYHAIEGHDFTFKS